MGRLACAAIEAADGLELVARCGRGDDLAARLGAARADVALDLTRPDVVAASALAIVDAGVRPVIGTSGIGSALRDELAARCAARGIGGLVVPNFAIGAVLMLRFAELAARWMPGAEIVEAHHAAKVDAPSGTAVATAERIAAARGMAPAAGAADAGPARGEARAGVRIHSLRLPGVVAEQQVVFGESGQRLTLEHVVYGREAYMPGVVLACRRVVELGRLVVGLDELLFSGRDHA